ncbi:glycine oxidase ThiO [Rhizobium sp. FKY42]|uniref:glycine oxidase ThiO n=1 Tax=Rhizobium sp. FKY42 TaxID=2562310 RepID=UPI0010C122C2|nr:glycine oxidase ThiO [Rhizobium sp. FKY42]
MSILIKGAGVAGLVLAYELRRRGLNVTLNDTAPSGGHGASYYAGGMLAPWCERESANETVFELGLSAADWWEQALPGLVHRKGTLVVAQNRDRVELERFAKRTNGYQWLDENGVAALEPALAGRFQRGLYFAGEAHLDPRKALRSLQEKLENCGVTMSFSQRLATPLRTFSSVVDCTGPSAIGTIKGLRGVRGEMLMLETRDIQLTRTVRVLHPRHPIYIVPRGEGRFMLGATMIESNDGSEASARSIMELLNIAFALHPAFGEARILETGAGVRPAFINNTPRIVKTRDGIAITGLYRHGFLAAPALAKEAADLLQRSRRKGAA